MTIRSVPHKIKTHLHNIRKQIPYLPQVLGWVWQAAPGYSVAWVVLSILQAILPVASVFLTRALVNVLFAGNLPGAQVLSQLLPLAAAQGGIMLLTGVLGSLQSWVRSNQQEKTNLFLTTMIYEKTSELDLAYFESSHYFDQLRRAMYDARSAPLELLTNVGTLVQNGITLLGMGGVLFSYGWWLPFLLGLGGLPPALSSILNNRRTNRWRKENTRRERRLYYYDWVLTTRQYAAELRVFQVAKNYIEKYRVLQQQITRERLGLQKKQLWWDQAASLLSLLVLGFIGLWALLGNLSGRILIGDLAMFWQVAQKGRGSFSSVLTSISSLYRNLLYLQDISELFEQKPIIRDPEFPEPFPAAIQEGIRLEGLRFQYPGHEKVVLENLDLFLPARKITALVGVNGAGKSTLIKLLCRFYDPDGGRIRVDGIDLRAISQQVYQRQIGVLMQFPAQFYSSAAHNIAVGEDDVDIADPALQHAAAMAGADEFIRKLPQGYDSMLGSMFDGVDLSGGEWLRIALARAFYRDCAIFLLDEPTEGMDSWAEMEWFDHFRGIAQEKVSFIITHRFTTAMQADVIHLIENGRIIESGSHAELVALDGRYAASWKRQMRMTGVPNP